MSNTWQADHWNNDGTRNRAGFLHEVEGVKESFAAQVDRLSRESSTEDEIQAGCMRALWTMADTLDALVVAAREGRDVVGYRRSFRVIQQDAPTDSV